MSKICNELQSALRAYTDKYEQVCYVIDAHVALSELAFRKEACLVLAVSEEEKTLETVAQIWDFLFAQETAR